MNVVCTAIGHKIEDCGDHEWCHRCKEARDVQEDGWPFSDFETVGIFGWTWLQLSRVVKSVAPHVVRCHLCSRIVRFGWGRRVEFCWKSCHDEFISF